MSKAVFITGTGTDMGKTYLSGLIVKKLAQAGKNPAYYKAAMSGNDRRADGSLIPGDALFVKEMSGISQSLDDMCPYVYENAWSPHLASRVEGNPVDLDVVRRGFLKAANDYEYITMEGSGLRSGRLLVRAGFCVWLLLQRLHKESGLDAVHLLPDRRYAPYPPSDKPQLHLRSHGIS